MFYYKLNLHYKDFTWGGSKAVKFKNFVSPQWLRNVKSKKYAFWRLDTFFLKKSIQIYTILTMVDGILLV